MEENIFDKGELCNGAFCVVRADCARFIGNTDKSKPGNYNVRTRRPWDAPCDYFLAIDDYDTATKHD